MNNYRIANTSQTASILSVGIIALTLSCNFQSPPTPKVNPKSQSYYTLLTPSTVDQYSNVHKGGDIMDINDLFVKEVTNFYSDLLSKQEELGTDFEQVLHNNLWDLYES